MGAWRITNTELWDRDALDLVEEAFIRFESEQLGELAMIALRADVDYRLETRTRSPASSSASWATTREIHVRAAGGQPSTRIRGRLYIHRGDDSAFEAVRVGTHSKARRRTRRGGGG